MSEIKNERPKERKTQMNNNERKKIRKEKVAI